MEMLKKLNRAEMKHVLGGYMAPPGGTGTPGGNNGNPCANGGCSNILGSYSNGTYGGGPCTSSTGGTTCHNYCADGASGVGGYYGWC
jgi:hypothetical protein